MRRVAGSRVAVAVGLAVLVSGCSEGQPSREDLSAYTEVMPPQGETVKFYVLTHCGVEHARIGDHWWRVETPLAKGDSGSAPAGWDDPYQEGRLTLESEQRAVFEAAGDEVVFLRTADDAEPPGCA